eukprot:4901719-Amphidinium_carterae.1
MSRTQPEPHRWQQSLIKCPRTANKSVVGVLHPDVGEAEYGCDLHKRILAMWQHLCKHPKTSEFRVGAALVTQCHRILKAVSPWASASGPASSVLLLALRLGFEVTLQGDIKW